MNKDNLPKEYKKIPVKYSTGTGMNAEYGRGNKTIYVYDGFFNKKEIEQIGILEHEYGHMLYDKFSLKDMQLWKTISVYGDKYISQYAEDKSIFLKGPQEEFCECLRIIEQAKILKKELKLNNFLDIKLDIALFLKNKYELQKT